MDETRALILARLEELRKEHKGFSKSKARWKHFHVEITPISEADFNDLDNIELVRQFERILRRHYTPM